jgi:lysophospholipase L1-like esterase
MTGKTFVNHGVAGNTIYGLKNRFERDVLPQFPDHCCIQGGTNDSLIGTPLEDSKADIRALIEKCLDAEITPVVGTVLPLGFE